MVNIEFVTDRFNIRLSKAVDIYPIDETILLCKMEAVCNIFKTVFCYFGYRIFKNCDVYFSSFFPFTGNTGFTLRISLVRLVLNTGSKILRYFCGRILNRARVQES